MRLCTTQDKQIIYGIFEFRQDLTEQIEEGKGVFARDADGYINFDRVINVNQNTTSGYNGPLSRYAGKLIGANRNPGGNVNRNVLIRRASMNSHDQMPLALPHQ